jgi:hypothetical protein
MIFMSVPFHPLLIVMSVPLHHSHHLHHPLRYPVHHLLLSSMSGLIKVIDIPSEGLIDVLH